MRRKEPLSAQVFRVMQPFNEPDPKKPPTSWSNLVRAHLQPEVLMEISMFYGETNSLEAHYAGLDYAYAPHRRRLARFPYHCRLFRAIDWLALTPHEIRELCNWDGTLQAKERYEHEHDMHIRDTTADLVPLASGAYPCDHTASARHDAVRARQPYVALEPTPEDDYDDDYDDEATYDDGDDLDMEMDMEVPDEPPARAAPENQGELLSIGTALNYRLLDASVSQGLDGLAHLDFNVEWENWLKEAQESGRWGDISSMLPSQLS